MSSEPSQTTPSRATKALEWAWPGAVRCGGAGGVFGALFGGRFQPPAGVIFGCVFGALFAGVVGLVTFSILGGEHVTGTDSPELPALIHRSQLGMLYILFGLWGWTLTEDTWDWMNGGVQSTTNSILWLTAACAALSLGILRPVFLSRTGNDAARWRTILRFVLRTGLGFVSVAFWAALVLYFFSPTFGFYGRGMWLWYPTFCLSNLLVAAALAGFVCSKFSSLFVPRRFRAEVVAGGFTGFVAAWALLSLFYGIQRAWIHFHTGLIIEFPSSLLEDELIEIHTSGGYCLTFVGLVLGSLLGCWATRWFLRPRFAGETE